MLIVCCEKCKYTDLGDGSTESKCPRCGGKMISLGVSPNQWNDMSKDDKDACISKATAEDSQEEAVADVTPVKSTVTDVMPNKTIPSAGESNTRLVSGICPQCGGKIKVDKTQDAAVCEHCGTPFIVDKAINIVNNNIHVSDKDIDTLVDKIKDRDGSIGERTTQAVPHVYNYFELFKKIDKANKDIVKGKKDHDTSFYLLLCVGIPLGVLTAAFFYSGIIEDKYFSMLLGCAFGAIEFIVLFVNTLIISESNKKKKLQEKALPELAKEASKCFQTISSVLPELPKEYYYPKAIDYIQNIFNTNRADNMRQALAMLDEQTHRWEMEEIAKKSLAVQQQQQAALNAIWWQNFLR